MINGLGDHRKALPERAAHRRDVGWRSVWRRLAPQAHGAESPRRTGDRNLAVSLFGACGELRSAIPSRDRGINGGVPACGGAPVYAAKALDRRESPAGNASALGCGVASLPRTPCRQNRTHLARQPVVDTEMTLPAFRAEGAHAGGVKTVHWRTGISNTCPEILILIELAIQSAANSLCDGL